MSFKNIIVKKGRNSDFLIICDHASNNIDEKYGNLGLEKKYINSHRAFDIGAKNVAYQLSRLLDCNLVMANFSRLIIDPNRGLDDLTLIPKLSEGRIIKGNIEILLEKDDHERKLRVKNYYNPYHEQIERFIDHALKKNVIPKIISIHSFTPIWKGKKRGTEVGILWDKDNRLSKIFLKSFKGYNVGDNQPYSGRLKNDTLYKHATLNGIPNVLIEIRQDLLASENDEKDWAKKIYKVLNRNKGEINSFSIKRFGSYAL
jgi:predicted N-formylglutamate amidohydrolase|tara:strand:- start:190 stop:966 length:777 start_codon:yes stop_codon:yes gene_type:complete